MIIFEATTLTILWTVFIGYLITISVKDAMERYRLQHWQEWEREREEAERLARLNMPVVRPTREDIDRALGPIPADPLTTTKEAS